MLMILQDGADIPWVLYAFPVSPMVDFACNSEHFFERASRFLIHQSAPILYHLWPSSDAATRRGLAFDASQRDSPSCLLAFSQSSKCRTSTPYPTKLNHIAVASTSHVIGDY